MVIQSRIVWGRMAVVMTTVLCMMAAAGSFTWAQEELPNPMTFEDALHLALDRNPSITAAEKDIDASHASLRGQKGRWLPELSAGWDWQKRQSLERTADVGGGTIRTTGGLSSSRSAALSLSQTFWQSGLQESIKTAREQLAADEAGLVDTQRSVLQDVASTYHTILAENEMARVAEEAVEAAETHLELVNTSIEAGIAAEADRLDVLSELAGARYDRVQAVNAVWQALADLRALLAIPIDQMPQVAQAPQMDYTHFDLEEWVDEALAKRPDLKARRHQVRVSELAVDRAKIDAGVSLSVNGTAGWGRYSGDTGDSWTLSATATFPLHSAPAKADVDRAHANLAASRDRFEHLQLSVTREVSTAWYALRNASERIAAAQASVDAAETNLESTREQYGAGVANIIEVTDAELQWRRARANLVQSRYDRNVAYYQLLASAGRILTEPDATAPPAGAPQQQQDEMVGDQ
ncbi:MAG: TolC family protein [Armatimonadota bacterium]